MRRPCRRALRAMLSFCLVALLALLLPLANAVALARDDSPARSALAARPSAPTPSAERPQRGDDDEDDDEEEDDDEDDQKDVDRENEEDEELGRQVQALASREFWKRDSWARDFARSFFRVRSLRAPGAPTAGSTALSSGIRAPRLTFTQRPAADAPRAAATREAATTPETPPLRQDAPTSRTTRSGQLFFPVDGRVTQRFSGRHTGIDIAAPYGTGVHAADAGMVSAVGRVPVGGIRVCLALASGLESCYYHLSAVHVKVGQTVARGEVVAAVGSTGKATGPHVHWEVKRAGRLVDPLGL